MIAGNKKNCVTAGIVRSKRHCMIAEIALLGGGKERIIYLTCIYPKT